MTSQSQNNEDPLFQEDRDFFIQKKLKELGLCFALLILPPLGLYYMFWYLIEWSSLFEKETASVLIFLILAPLGGFYFLARLLLVRRFTVYPDRITSPVLLSKRMIPMEDIAKVTVKYNPEDGPVTATLHLKEGATSTRDPSPPLGEYLDKDGSGIIAAFNKAGVKAGWG